MPVDTINRIIPQLIANGKVVRPGLGIHIASEQISRQLNLDGVLVLDVPAGSAAAGAGLKGTTESPSGGWILGDVITGIDGQPVHAADDLYRELDKHKVGDKVELEILRNHDKQTLAVKLQALN